MKSKNVKPVIILFFLISCVTILSSWGTWGHQHINKAAVFALPTEMRPFFYNHIDFITEESVVPDLRKYILTDKSENPRHFMDMENFGPADSLPKTLAEAKKKYDDKFLQSNGILPWYIIEMMEKLTKAFKEKKKTEILFLAADLGHYIGDAQMPLHTSANHDGQMTNQKGIHSFWESQIPEQLGDMYNLNTGNAKYIDDISKKTWEIIAQTHKLVDTVLLVEKSVNSNFPQDEVYKKNEKGEILKNKYNASIHSLAYAKKYHDALNGMIEKQMRLAISTTADYWYTAWVNAGKPDLSLLDDVESTKANKINYEKDSESWKKGKVTKLKIDTEF